MYKRQVYYRTNNRAKWSTKKPTRTSVGTTAVYYKIVNSNCTRTKTGSAKITIKKAIQKGKAKGYSGSYNGKAHTISFHDVTAGTKIYYRTSTRAVSYTHLDVYKRQVYNKQKVHKTDLEKEGFNIFHNTKYKGHIYMYDSERDSFMMALKALGYSMNTSDKKELKDAYDWLVKAVDIMDPEIVTDEVIDAMINGNKDMALVYSGDAAYILSENEDMDYYMPKEGTNLWSDAMVIPKNAKNPKLANDYINFLLDYEASMKNTLFVGYASSNEEVLDCLLYTSRSSIYGIISPV